MADLAGERDIETIPKVELHVHLQGSITAGLRPPGRRLGLGLVVDAIRDFRRPEAEATLSIVEGAELPSSACV